MAKILKIRTLPKYAKELRQSSAVISATEIASKEFERLLTDMVRTMQVKDGVGLAAPQIGKAVRAVIINTKDGPLCMINPSISKKSLGKEVGEEGCLSIPNIFGQVKRNKTLCCEFLDTKGMKKKIEARGLMARAIQHELDHLDGILFIDRLEPPKKN
jgi:peptide deformylase